MDTVKCEKCGEKTNYSSVINTYVCFSCGHGTEGMKVIDIGFKKDGIAKALSNFCPYSFEIDDVFCYSMESFIQSLRVKNEEIQREVCQKTSAFNYSIRTVLGDWRIERVVHWKGRTILRTSEEYLYLLERAYRLLFEKNTLFRHALMLSNGYTLIHSIGNKNNLETLLTEDEYISFLNMLRHIQNKIKK